MAMKINLTRMSLLEEFIGAAKIFEALNHDLNRHTDWFRKQIESEIVNHNFDGDLRAALIGIKAGYKKKIDAVETQAEYDELFLNLFDVSCFANVIAGNMRLYSKQLENHIERMTQSGSQICPCCGKALSDEFLDRQRQDCDEHEELERFYNKFFEHRETERERLRKIGISKKFDLTSWGKDLKSYGSQARVEEIEGEPCEVDKVLKELMPREKAAGERAREWVAAKKAAGFQFVRRGENGN